MSLQMLQEWLPLIISFVIGLVAGITLVLIFNKARSGSISPAKLKQEMQDYQQKVEEHFETTSDKFKNMTMQYQDFYQHLATGATELCSAEHVNSMLSHDEAPLKKQLEQSKSGADDSDNTSSDVEKKADLETKQDVKEQDAKEEVAQKLKKTAAAATSKKVDEASAEISSSEKKSA